MGRRFQLELLVGNVVLLQADNLDELLAGLLREKSYWTSVFVDGVQSNHSETKLLPHYSELMSAVQTHPFENGSFDLQGKAEFAIYPARASVEGRALAHYANTEIAFAILWYLWAEAGWLNELRRREEVNAVAEGSGELLVTAVRLGSSFR